MGNNTYGALKGKLTRHHNERVREYEEERISEILRNKDRWFSVVEGLKEIDKDFDEWYDSDVIPEEIRWRGKEFEEVFYTVNERLILVKRSKDE